ncbi:hypothetical protein Dred_2899 [Desulforamulus reducens MI-1]|uniref:YmaF family protein n=1 Tax=Desulforamulus reducens (strain ATCC BAA-1160 / DSM 100696 / MI-1) TaxID=349161 RepID=A4J8K0_DESRM|nr:YmaF family protein [Desulforamulus reducens]ABO51403.1 hypothetical protein Dred_2899 [Desulforamulus reducens MI-1]
MSVIIADPIPFHHHFVIGRTATINNHYHSFSGVTGPEIPLPHCANLGHVHEIYVTHCSFLYMHNHQIKGITGPPIWLSETEHYHIIYGSTYPCPADNHIHDFSGSSKIFCL